MDKSDHVQSLNRALDIIEVLAVKPEGLGVSEIAKKVNLHKSTAHRLISTLAARGYLKKNNTGNYKIGLKLIESVSCYINSLELQTEARPYLSKITGDLGLTSHLGVLEKDKVVYIEKMDVVSSIKLYNDIGLRVHAYCSSLGKCLLAKYSKEEVENVLVDCSFIKFTKNTIPSITALHKELYQVRKQGWGMDNEEFKIGHRCIGAPIYDYRGDIIAAISASGSTKILTNDSLDEVIYYVQNTAKEISKSMGYNE